MVTSGISIWERDERTASGFLSVTPSGPSAHVAFEYQAQAEQGEVGTVVVDRLRLGKHQRGQPTGGDHRHPPGAPYCPVRRRCDAPGRPPGRRTRRGSRTAGTPPCSCRSPTRGRTSSTLRSAAARAASASTEISMPGANTPPRNSPFAEITSMLVDVPKSTTTHGGAVQVVRGQRVDRPGRRRPPWGCPPAAAPRSARRARRSPCGTAS